MASATLVTVGEYLRTRYEPDAEYMDGIVEKRPMGELDHNRLQKELLRILSEDRCLSYFESIQEQRVQVATQRFRVPDICLLRADAPEEQIATIPPLLCIEILSPEDTMPRTMIRIRDFLAMGVPQVWVVDPLRRTIQVCDNTTSTTHTEGILAVPETPITVSLASLFSVLDRKQRGIS